MTKEFLSKQKIPFESKNINDPEIRKELEGRGFLTVPVTFIDGVGIDGFKPGKLSKALNLNGAGAKIVATTDNMYERLDTVLDAWGRAIRQLDAAHLTIPAGVADMDLRRYGHVIPRHVKVTMLARKSGIWDSAQQFQNSGWRKMKEPEDVGRYTDGVRKSFGRWAQTLSGADLGKQCSGFYGDVTLSRLIEISLGRAAFHLGRLYELMRSEANIEPNNPVSRKELDAIGIPADVMGQ